MGTEAVFVLIYPIALGCLLAGIWFWAGLAKVQPTSELGVMRLFLPFIAGFVISMMGLALLSYGYGYAEFTDLVSQGYYNEAERSRYLPRRIVGLAIVYLVFVLPALCLVVVPVTTGLIRKERLTWANIGLRALAGWCALLLIGSLMSADAPLALLVDAALPVLIYGLPIPVAALLLLPSKGQAGPGSRPG